MRRAILPTILLGMFLSLAAGELLLIWLNQPLGRLGQAGWVVMASGLMISTHVLLLRHAEQRSIIRVQRAAIGELSEHLAWKRGQIR